MQLSSENAGLAEIYRRNSLSHGAPAPEDIIFRASAYALAGAPVPALGQGDLLSPHLTMKALYRRIAVHFSALPHGITFLQQADGRRDASVSFDVYVYADDGTLLLTNGHELKLHLTPLDYQRIMNSVVSMDLVVSVLRRTRHFFAWGSRTYPRAALELLNSSPGVCLRLRLRQTILKALHHRNIHSCHGRFDCAR
jgi:hypothetical protein